MPHPGIEHPVICVTLGTATAIPPGIIIIGAAAAFAFAFATAFATALAFAFATALAFAFATALAFAFAIANFGGILGLTSNYTIRMTSPIKQYFNQYPRFPNFAPHFEPRASVHKLLQYVV
jgi:hypothetical protein